MANQILDDGGLKAAGRASIGANAAGSTLRAIGISAATWMAAGRMQVTLLEPIGVDELVCELTADETVDCAIVASRVSDTVIEFRSFNTAGAAAARAFWFALYRVGTDQQGAVTVAAP